MFGATPGTAFGANSTPAFSFSAPATSAAPSPFGFGTAQPATAFGSSSATAFGAPQSTSAFGSTTTPALGAPTTSAAPVFGFGANSAAAFGAASAPAFGAASTAAFATGSSLFGSATTPAFGAPASQPAAAFGTAPQAQQRPAVLTYQTKFDELSADHQRHLRLIQQEVSSCRDDSKLLDEDQRLNDPVALKKSLEEETKALRQKLQGLLNLIKADDEALTAFREKVLALLKATEFTVRVFMRNHVWRQMPRQGAQAQGAAQLSLQVVQEALNMPVTLPSPYLQQAVIGFQDALQQYQGCISELEQVPKSLSSNSDPTSVHMLPNIISHMHDFFVHVAALLERLHNQVQAAKDAFLQQRRAVGDFTDPFEEARRHHHLATSINKPVIIPPASHSHQPHGTTTPGVHGAVGGATTAAGTPQSPFSLAAPVAASAFGTPQAGLSAQTPPAATASRASAKRR